MSFLNPIGLLGLIGVFILILIYIIKSKYQEYTIASTYIWELSEKFTQKKSPLSKLSGLLSLILQILIIITLSLALAHPILKIPNSAKSYVFVVDNSASMNINNRFEVAKEKMIEIVNDAKNDSEFDIIIAGEEAISLCEKKTNKEDVIQIIEKMKVTTISSSVSLGMEVAQDLFTVDNSLNVYLFTDSRYASIKNINVINLENNEYNAAINSLYYTISDENINFVGEIISYNVDKTLSLELYLDDVLKANIEVECFANVNTKYNFVLPLIDFDKASVKIATEDNLNLDNEYVTFANESIDKFNILLVSENPFYLETIISVLGNNNLTTTSTYTSQSGYDLYVFDSYAPANLPTDGSVWLFNIGSNISNSGFATQGNITIKDGASLSLTRNNNNIYNSLTNGLTGNNIVVSSFKQYSLISSYTTILSYQSYPMVFAGTNDTGNRQVVFSFDLHDSNLPLLIDYIILFNNMLKYSLPSICDKSNFVCGDELVLNVLPNLESIRIYTPSNYSTYLSTEDAFATYKLSEIGTYIVEAEINNIIKTYKIFVGFPLDEQNPIKELESIELTGEKNNVAFDSSYDAQWLLFIILTILCILEWGVYVYEQRKVR